MFYLPPIYLASNLLGSLHAVLFNSQHKSMRVYNEAHFIDKFYR